MQFEISCPVQTGKCSEHLCFQWVAEIWLFGIESSILNDAVETIIIALSNLFARVARWFEIGHGGTGTAARSNDCDFNQKEVRRYVEEMGGLRDLTPDDHLPGKQQQHCSLLSPRGETEGKIILRGRSIGHFVEAHLSWIGVAMFRRYHQIHISRWEETSCNTHHQNRTSHPELTSNRRFPSTTPDFVGRCSVNFLHDCRFLWHVSL